jgi:hypothetical protein
MPDGTGTVRGTRRAPASRSLFAERSAGLVGSAATIVGVPRRYYWSDPLGKRGMASAGCLHGPVEGHPLVHGHLTHLGLFCPSLGRSKGFRRSGAAEIIDRLLSAVPSTTAGLALSGLGPDPTYN